jgi:acetyl-CoA C-acetyltransferase
VYSTEPGPVVPPDQAHVQAQLDSTPQKTIADEHDGSATVDAYSVVHGRDGAPEWGVLVCDVGDGKRAYAKVTDPALLASAEERELVGTTVQCTPETVSLATGGEGRRNLATW